MTAAGLVDALLQQGVELWADGDRLRFNAPRGTMTPTLRQQLADRKAELLQFLQSRQTVTPMAPPPIRAVPRDGALPLSFLQQRLWFLDRLQPGNSANSIPVALRLSGSLDVAALEHCLNTIAGRHEILRTSVGMASGRPVQVIEPEIHLKLPVVDLCHVPEHRREAAAIAWAREEGRQPFDLARAPLLRVTLLRLAPDEHVLVLVTHHFVADGWSINVLQQEIGLLYTAVSRNMPATLPPLPVQFADYAAWQRQWVQGDVLDVQLSYWKQQLAGSLPLLDLPADRPRPPVQTFEGA
ncbi:MAG TPA: condensation domain-containing protein, partial [Chloroflexota bacterium]|nr:condensation domain-containing protein [Chloroflexota bacterium]